MAKKQERTYDDTGMRNLMIAVLQNAVDTINMVNRRTTYLEAMEAIHWFYHHGPDWLEALDIGAPAESLRQWLTSCTHSLILAEETRAQLAEIDWTITRITEKKELLS